MLLLLLLRAGGDVDVVVWKPGQVDLHPDQNIGARESHCSMAEHPSTPIFYKSYHPYIFTSNSVASWNALASEERNVGHGVWSN